MPERLVEAGLALQHDKALLLQGTRMSRMTARRLQQIMDRYVSAIHRPAGDAAALPAALPSGVSRPNPQSVSGCEAPPTPLPQVAPDYIRQYGQWMLAPHPGLRTAYKFRVQHPDWPGFVLTNDAGVALTLSAANMGDAMIGGAGRVVNWTFSKMMKPLCAARRSISSFTDIALREQRAASAAAAPEDVGRNQPVVGEALAQWPLCMDEHRSSVP